MEESIPSADHRSALRRVINHLLMCAIKEIDAFGHRIVHGGAYFRKPVLIDDEVLKRIEALSVLAPLHNPPGAQGSGLPPSYFPINRRLRFLIRLFIRRSPACISLRDSGGVLR